MSLCRFYLLKIGFPGVVKKLSADAGDMGLIPGWGRSPGRGHGNPAQDSCLENTHGQRSLVGYRSQSCKEAYMTEATEHAHMQYGW